MVAQIAQSRCSRSHAPTHARTRGIYTYSIMEYIYIYILRMEYTALTHSVPSQFVFLFVMILVLEHFFQVMPT